MRRYVACLLVLLAQTGFAGVVQGTYSVTGKLQGMAGDDVSLTVNESDLSGYQGAELTFRFDPAVLDFLAVGPSTYGTPFALRLPDAGGLASYSLFLTTNGDVNGPVELFTLLFKIDSDAMVGTTDIAFTNDNSGHFDPGVYDRPSLSGVITVLPPVDGTMPVISTMPLTLTGLALLAFVRRRRRIPALAPGLRRH